MPAEEIALPRHLSYSQVATMGKCSHQWFLERGLRLQGQVGWAQLGGSAAHAATEDWDRKVADGKLPLVPDPYLAGTFFNAHFDDEIARAEEGGASRADFRASGRVSKEWPDKRNEKWWRVNGPEMVLRWMTWRQNSPWDLAYLPDEQGVAELAVEVKCEAELGGVPVVMAIDRVMEVGGQLMILDLKFGDHVPDDDTQLATYRAGVLARHGLDVQWGCYWMGKDGSTTIPVDLSQWSAERMDYLYRTTRQVQEMGIFRPQRSPLCSACSVRDYCYAWGGERAAEVPAPWEVTITSPLAPVTP